MLPLGAVRKIATNYYIMITSTNEKLSVAGKYKLAVVYQWILMICLTHLVSV